MSRPLVAGALLALGICVSGSAAPDRLVISDVSVVDTTGGPLLPHRDVVIQGAHITAVRASGPPDADAHVVDGRGRFLIPGLWDMHAHAFNRDDVLADSVLQLQIVNGVTGVRDMGGLSMTTPVLFRRAGDAGILRLPHLVVAGKILDGPTTLRATAIAVANADEGRRAVDAEADAGVDFIKVYADLSRDTYYAIADEARKRGLPFGGHVPIALTVREAAEAGQATVEHFWGVVLGCSSREDELTEAERIENAKPPRTQYRGHLTTAQAAIDSFDERKAQALFHLFVEHQTYQVPTLHALSKFGTGPGPEPGMEYMPRSIQRIMQNGQGRMDPALRADARIYYAQVLKLVAEMYRAGVPFMAGTDEPVPGFALHQDLEQFVKAGLTPLQALEAATIVPARFLHRDDRAGSIAVGKDADLVLLDDDPTRDIRNTTKIRAVVIRGELLDRAALDGMLARIKAAVN